jgi:glycine hydroxymethyltransferase
VRIGSPAVTTRGFSEIECEELAHLIADILDAPADAKTQAHVTAGVKALTSKFPVYK